MADTMEIIISAVDSASEVFQSIIQSAQSMADGISGSLEGASSDFEMISENVASFSDVVFSVDNSTLEELADTLGMDVEEVERLIQTGADIGSISAGFNEVASAADELEQELQDDIDKMDELGSAGDVMAAQTLMDFASGVSDSMQDMANRAGTVQDSFTRLGLAAEGAGIDVDTMKGAVSDLSDETGRAGSSIRESFIAMTSAGITDMNTMQTVFKGASAQAFILNTDVDALASKFSGLAMRSSISETRLKGTGITMKELGEAMGLTGATADEVKEKWKELDVNQRAAALGMAASMNEGKDANDAYKNSWQGLQDQMEIAKGKLLTMAGNVLLPVLVPAMKLATDILSGLGAVVDAVMKGPFGGLVSVIGASAGIFMIAVTGAMALKNILGFLKIEAMLTKVEMVALAFAEELQSGGSIASAAANAIGATGFSGLAASAWAAATAIWAAISPLLPFIAAAALVAVAIFEVGKAFGWWTDVSSMLDAIKAGLTRLWNAFINHPDVQAAIQVIGDAFNAIAGAIGWAWNALLEFFGVATGGDFDIVRALIDGIGAAWNAIRTPIMFVINLIQNVITVFNAFRTGQMDLPSFIIQIGTLLINAYMSVFQSVIRLVIQFGSQMLSYAIRAGRNFLNGVANQIRQVPGRVYSLLMTVVNRIRSAIQAWISAGVAKVRQLIKDITSPFTGVADKISSALSGVAKAITGPFESAYDTVVGIVDNLKQKVQEGLEYIGSLGGAAGGDMAAGGETINGYEGIASETIIVDNSPIEVDHNLNVLLDLQNVPSHISTQQLVSALTDRKVLRELTSNSDFQLLDSQAKERLNLKLSRSRGV